METVSEQLQRRGHSIWPNFLPVNPMAELRTDFSRIEAQEGFSRAGTGQGEEHSVKNGTRTDSVHWLGRDQGNVAQDRLWKKIDTLQKTLNRNLFLNLDHFEGHYASYPAGGFYGRHFDCFRQDDARMVSFVLYLNKNWRSEDGGRLRIHSSQGGTTDIDPVGGTMVCFLSRDTDHEVMESFAPRASVTGWFKLAPTLH